MHVDTWSGDPCNLIPENYSCWAATKLHKTIVPHMSSLGRHLDILDILKSKNQSRLETWDILYDAWIVVSIALGRNLLVQ